MTVTSNGLERTVCHECGNVSFRFSYAISDDFDRSKFARDADQRAVRV